jgi:hypothetical protein
MNKQTSKKHLRGFNAVLWLLSAFLLMNFLVACDTIQDALVSQSPTTEETKPDLPPEDAYMAAILDAAVAEPNEISTNLTAIVEHNTELVWQGDAESRNVLMATWTSWDGYAPNLGKSMELEIDIWVTAVPHVQKFYREHNLGGQPTAATRLEQLLGLAPNTAKTKFVEMWVNPADMFRPCPDPEITDLECELNFPQSQNFFTVNQDHVEWINANIAEKYPPAPDSSRWFPWTRLGYTYDWGNRRSEVGLSEFVIKRGATVGVHSITPTADYCR